MKTVIYYDYIRNRKNLIQNILVWTILFLLLFVVSLVIEKVIPGFSREYLKWPDMAQNLLAVGNWNNHVYINLWQIITLVFPIYIVYVVMNGLCATVIQEDRLETMVYLQNMSVGRMQVLLAKLLFWVAYAFIMYVVLLLENVVFFLLLGSGYNLSILVNHYEILFVSTVIYLMIALFLASYEKHENRCADVSAWVLFLSLILSKVGAFVHFVVDLMIMKGQEGEIIGKVEAIAQKLDVLIAICPMSWCWAGVEVTSIYMIGGIVIGCLLCVGSCWIYAGRGNSR